MDDMDEGEFDKLWEEGEPVEVVISGCLAEAWAPGGGNVRLLSPWWEWWWKSLPE